MRCQFSGLASEVLIQKVCAGAKHDSVLMALGPTPSGHLRALRTVGPPGSDILCDSHGNERLWSSGPALLGEVGFLVARSPGGVSG